MYSEGDQCIADTVVCAYRFDLPATDSSGGFDRTTAMAKAMVRWLGSFLVAVILLAIIYSLPILRSAVVDEGNAALVKVQMQMQ